MPTLNLKKFDMAAVDDTSTIVFVGKRSSGISFALRDLLWFYGHFAPGTIRWTVGAPSPAAAQHDPQPDDDTEGEQQQRRQVVDAAAVDGGLARLRHEHRAADEREREDDHEARDDARGRDAALRHHRGE
jgi:hypothetical protein